MIKSGFKVKEDFGSTYTHNVNLVITGFDY